MKARVSVDDMWRFVAAEIARREIVLRMVSPEFAPSVRAEIAILTAIAGVIDAPKQGRAA